MEVIDPIENERWADNVLFFFLVFPLFFFPGLLQLEIIDPIEVDPRVFVELLIKEIDKGVRDGLIDCHEFIKVHMFT